MNPYDKAAARWPNFKIIGDGPFALACRIRKTVKLCQNTTEQNKLALACDCVTIGVHEYADLDEEVRSGRDHYGFD